MTPIAPISSIFSNISKPIQNQVWNGYLSNTIQPTTNVAILVQTFPWLKDKSLMSALLELKDLKFDEKEINYLKNMGVNVPFKSGNEALKCIADKNIRILFDKPAENDIHAQYDFTKNTVTINSRYKGTNDFSVILAICEAILHEVGHANDNDGDSSVQEELDFLGMNVIAHREFLRKYNDVFSQSNEPIINDGVSIYEKLFFDPDPDKKKLINRMKEKYGDLPAGDRLHPPGFLALAIKK